ncbi:MAG: hypothetical protein K5837_01810 [Candidatus Saccharibacteria bacterium]|nr:hypothetical protein [Candidatus Saccharibacteria bacterium]
MKRIISILIVIAFGAAMFRLGGEYKTYSEKEALRESLEKEAAEAANTFSQLATSNHCLVESIGDPKVYIEEKRAETPISLRRELIDENCFLTFLHWSVLVEITPERTVYRCWSGSYGLKEWKSALEAYSSQEGVTQEMPKPDPFQEGPGEPIQHLTNF